MAVVDLAPVAPDYNGFRTSISLLTPDEQRARIVAERVRIEAELAVVEADIAEDQMARLRSGRDTGMEWFVRSRALVDDRLRYLLRLDNLLAALDRHVVGAQPK